MIFNDWVKTLWTVLNVRSKKLSNYKHMYKLNAEPVIGSLDLDELQLIMIKSNYYDYLHKRRSTC